MFLVVFGYFGTSSMPMVLSRSIALEFFARGNEQSEGVDYLETYSPVVRSATVRTVLHIATVMH